MRSVAIIGASNDATKYGCAAVRAFLKAGWTVYPVNPKETNVAGLPAFRSVADVPQPLDWISVYVPPKIGKKLLPDFAAAQAGEIWFNPGAADGELLQECAALGLKAVSGCSIRAIGMNPDDFF